MKKKCTIMGLVVLLIFVVSGGQLIFADAAASPPGDLPLGIEDAVWEAVQVSPGHESTFVVRLRAEGGPETAIDAQFRLEKMLDILAGKGDLRDYQSYYGENMIKITGGVGVLRMLADWPELVNVSLYQPGETWELNAESVQDTAGLDATGQFSGKVTASNGTTALSGIRVTAYRQTGSTTWSNVGNVLTNASGTYAISGLAAGFYRARFEDPAGNYVTEYYNNKTAFDLATIFSVSDGSTTPNINAALAQAGKISGTVTKAAGGGGASDVVASAWTNSGGTWVLISNALTNTSGVYTIGGLPAGTYRVKFSDSYVPKRYLDQWYQGALTVDTAQNITVTAGTTVSNINAAMGSYGSIKGNVKAADGVTNLAEINVDAYRFRSTSWEWFSYGTTDASGNYEVNGLSTENYRVQFTDTLGQFKTEFYNDKPDLASANNVAVSLGFATTNINAQLALNTNTVTNSLVSGWNLISLPVKLADNSPSAAFASISGSHGDIWAYDACDTTDHWKLYNPALPAPSNDLTAVSVTAGYWVKMISPATLSLNGEHLLKTTIGLCPGWNLIGYPSVTTRPVADALASISGKYSLVRQYRASDLADPWKSYNPNVPPSFNDLVNMEPGFGYWIFMTQAATLTIQGR